MRGGARLLVTGRFDLDERFRSTPRHREVGLDYPPRLLDVREHAVALPGGESTSSIGRSCPWERASRGSRSTIPICPTPLERATLYVLTAESGEPREVRVRDRASGAELTVPLAPGAPRRCS